MPMSVKKVPISLEEISSEGRYGLAFQPFDLDLRKLLVQVTGEADAASIITVKIKVVTKQAGLHRLADYTPRLKKLILDGSCVDSLRDLGSSLKNLQTLSVVGCNLKSLDGLWGFRSLNTLIARKNSIKDPSPCSGVCKLVELDLAENEIDNPHSFGFLRNSKHLRVLEVSGNNFDDYKNIILNLLPQIRVLDKEDIAVDNEEHEESEEEVDSMSEDDELFFSGDEEKILWLSKKKRIDFPLKKYAELGAGDDNTTTLALNKNSKKHFEDDDVKCRAHDRNLDFSSSSIFLMTHEFDNISMIDLNTRNVGDARQNLEVSSSKLSSGRAIYGNLAASLRPRNLSKSLFTLPAVSVELKVDDNNVAKN